MSWCDDIWVDSPSLEPISDWCPTCAPHANLTQAWVMRYCDGHLPTHEGALDPVVDKPSYIAQGEADGRSGKLICDLIHRKVLSTC